VRGLGGDDPDLQYNNAIPLLMGRYLPEGMLGLGVTGLLAAFMAGVAANVTSFNTVVSYDIWQAYFRKDKPDEYYVRFGRIATVVGVLIAIGTAFIAEGYTNIMNYIQALFSIFNAPLFATFIIGMFWRRMTPAAGLWGLVGGTVAALVTYVGYKAGWFSFGSDLDESFWGAGLAFGVDAAVSIAVTLGTTPKPTSELQGLVYGMANVEDKPTAADRGWYRSPGLLGFGALAAATVLTIVFF
jgi:SSS family solute:Na+ symporter